MTFSIFLGSHSRPSLPTTCPRKGTDDRNKWYFDDFSCNPYERSHSKIIVRLSSESPNAVPNEMMSSKYTKQQDHRKPCSTRSINLSKVAGALHKPKGMTLNWNRPECVAKAVLHLASGDRDTCQYPLARSRVENQRLPANISSVSSIRGNGYASIFGSPRRTGFLRPF